MPAALLATPETARVERLKAPPACKRRRTSAHRSGFTKKPGSKWFNSGWQRSVRLGRQYWLQPQWRAALCAHVDVSLVRHFSLDLQPKSRPYSVGFILRIGKTRTSIEPACFCVFIGIFSRKKKCTCRRRLTKPGCKSASFI